MHVKSKEYMPLAKQNATLKKRNMNALFFREKEKKNTLSSSEEGEKEAVNSSIDKL